MYKIVAGSKAIYYCNSFLHDYYILPLMLVTIMGRLHKQGGPGDMLPEVVVVVLFF